MNDIWRPIPDHPHYIVSSRGFIAHVLRGKIHHGYRQYELPIAIGRRRNMMAHRAVALAFHGKPPKRNMDASFKDGNRKNITPHNICWRIRRETMLAKREHGTQPIHEKHHWAKLTMAKAERIRKLAKRGYDYVRLARQFCVSRNTIRRVIKMERKGGWNPADRRYARKLKSHFRRGRQPTR